VLAAIARGLAAAPALGAVAHGWAGLAVLAPPSGALAPLPLLLIAAWAALLALVALGTGATARRPVWTGGVPQERGEAPIHPRGFYSPVREAMRRAYPMPQVPHFARPRWIVPAADFDRWFYRPAGAAGRRVTDGLRRAHTGVPHLYLAWQLVGATAIVGLVLLLVRR
jgi:hydrogenase-4 component B